MMKFALLLAVTYVSAVDSAYLNSLTAADAILTKVNGDYKERIVYFPNIYSNEKVWNAAHTAFQIAQEVNCVNGSVLFTDFQRMGFPSMSGDATTTYLTFTVKVGQLHVRFATCDGITNKSAVSPATPAPTTLAPATPAAATPAPAKPAPTTTVAPTPATPPTPAPLNSEVKMRNDFPYGSQLQVSIAIKSASGSCTAWVQSIKPDSFSWDSSGYWNDVFDQLQKNMRSTFQYELQPIFQSALSESEVCYLLD